MSRPDVERREENPYERGREQTRYIERPPGIEPSKVPSPPSDPPDEPEEPEETTEQDDPPSGT